MKNGKFPTSLFIVGFIMNLILRFWYIFVSALLFMFVGIFIKPCLTIGIFLLLIDIIVSLVIQLFVIKTIYDSDDLNDIILKDGDNWRNNVMNFVNEKINEQKDDEEDNNSHE